MDFHWIKKNWLGLIGGIVIFIIIYGFFYWIASWGDWSDVSGFCYPLWCD